MVRSKTGTRSSSLLVWVAAFGEGGLTSAVEGAASRSANSHANVETLDGYLENLASDRPVPGGGSAAAVVAASGAALVAMVARICRRNPKYAAFGEVIQTLIEDGDATRRRLEAARQRDERAFARVVAAQGLPKETPAEKSARTEALESALRAAAEEPLETAALALHVVRFAAQLLEIPNKNLASDVGCAAEFGYAALAACAYNVRVNHRYMRDATTIESQAVRLASYEDEASATISDVRRVVAEALARARS